MLTVEQATTRRSATDKQDRWIPSSCSLCYGMCSILGHNVDGTLTKISQKWFKTDITKDAP